MWKGGAAASARLAGEVARITAPVLGKRGFASAQLIAEWASIVGAELADKITPDRLAFPRGERRDGTLRVRVAPGLAPEIQHRSPLILERINAFFGYRAVSRLALVQGPPTRAAPSGAASARGRSARTSGPALTGAWPGSRIRRCARHCAASARRLSARASGDAAGRPLPDLALPKKSP